MVLFVDDDEGIREAIESLFEDLSWTVVCVATNEEAMQAIRNERPRIIFVDLHRPGASVSDLIAAIRGHPEAAEVPIVAITGEFLAELPAGFSGALLKPFDMEEFVALVEVPPAPGQPLADPFRRFSHTGWFNEE